MIIGTNAPDKSIPAKYTVQIPAIPKLTFDWSQIVAREGKQVATVGTHWPMSRAFNKQELDNFLRAGACMGCHQNMSEPELWKKISVEGSIDNKTHIELMNKMIKYMVEQNVKPVEMTKQQSVRSIQIKAPLAVCQRGFSNQSCIRLDSAEDHRC